MIIIHSIFRRFWRGLSAIRSSTGTYSDTYSFFFCFFFDENVQIIFSQLEFWNTENFQLKVKFLALVLFSTATVLLLFWDRLFIILFYLFILKSTVDKVEYSDVLGSLWERVQFLVSGQARENAQNFQAMDHLVEEDFVRALIVEGRWTHKQVSNLLKEKYPDKRGVSEISVRRYCEVHNIHKTSRLTDDQLDVVVNNAVCQVK